MTEFVQHLVNGISLGTIYALIALGYTMVYGVLKLINFAHGDVYMVGAFMGFYVAGFSRVEGHPQLAGAGLPGDRSAPCSSAGRWATSSSGSPTGRSADRPRLTALITAIGVSFLLEFGFQLNFRGSDFPPGPTPRIFPTLLQGYDTGWLSGLRVNLYNTDLLTLGVAIALMVALAVDRLPDQVRDRHARGLLRPPGRGADGHPGEPDHLLDLRAGQRRWPRPRASSSPSPARASSR